MSESEEKKEIDQSENSEGQTKSSIMCSHKCSVHKALIAAIAVVVLFGIGFCAGRSSDRRSVRQVNSRAVFTPMMRNGGQRMMGSGRRGSFGQGIVGTISKIDGDNLTVKYNDKEITVTVTADTSIIKSGEIAKQSDVADNQTVSVSGTSKSDGSVVATQIRIK